MDSVEIFNTLDNLRWTIIAFQDLELQKNGTRERSNDALKVLDELWDNLVELDDLNEEEIIIDKDEDPADGGWDPEWLERGKDGVE